MKGKIYLIGGGEIAKGETKTIDESIKKATPKGSLFVFFATAADDSEDYAKTIISVFEDHFNVIVASREKGRYFMEDAIKNASVIYLGGGMTQLLLDLFEKWELVHLLREANEHGTLIVGMSAGAQALCEYYIHEEDNSFELRKGWGIVSLGCLVHANENSFLKSQELCLKSMPKKLKFIGIGEKVSWCIDNSKEYVVGEGSIWEN